MNSNSSRDMDSLIDEVLRSESLLAVPDAFEHRMERSLRMAARIQQERVQFHKRLVFHLQLIAAAALAVVTVGALTGLAGWLSQAPGAMGFLDYASTDAMRVLGVLPGVGAGALLVPIVLAMLMPALPALRNRMTRTR